MSIGLEPGERFTVDLGGKQLAFRHLSVREARVFTEQLTAYIDAMTKATTDDAICTDAITLIGPYYVGSVDLIDLLRVPELCNLPAEFQRQRQVDENELGKSLWLRTYGVASSASTVSEGASTVPAPTNPSSSNTT